MFKTIFSQHNKMGEGKIWGLLPPNGPRVCAPGQNRRQKVFHWGPSCLCWG